MIRVSICVRMIPMLLRLCFGIVNIEMVGRVWDEVIMVGCILFRCSLYVSFDLFILNVNMVVQWVS